MLKKYLKKLKSLKSNLGNRYIKFCSLPIDEKLVLVEGGQGSNINGNMFAMLKELQTNPRWVDYTVVFVVTDETMQKAKKRMAFYGFSRVILSVRNSKEYCKYLATAKYIMTDNSFPPYFNKRDEQVFLNTWHGTPLKTLGKANKSSLNSIANVQKNYLMSDYALFPNEFTKQVFMNDYDLRNIFSGQSLIANYPRNYIFYDRVSGEEMKKKLGYEGKKVFAYMPTWRDAKTEYEKQQQLKITKNILSEFDKKLDENSVLLVNLHFLLACEIKCDKFRHVEYFCGDYDTYEILNACDGLITDYSSVFFDYAVTGKKIILFAYDKEDYLKNRGIYMPFESLPFPIVEDVDSCIAEMQTKTEVPTEFLKEFCPNGSVHSCEYLFEMMVNGKTDEYKLEKSENKDKKLCLIYGGTLPWERMGGIKAFVEKNPQYKYVIAYRKNLTTDKKEVIDRIEADISVLGLITAFQFTVKEFFSFALRYFLRIAKKSKVSEQLFEREAKRLFHGVAPDLVVDFSNLNAFMAGVISKLSGEKQYSLNRDFVYLSRRETAKMNYSRKIERTYGFSEIDYSETENRLFIENSDGTAHPSWRKYSRMLNILPLYFNVGGKMKCFSMFYLKTATKTRLSDTSLSVADIEYKPKFFALTKIKARRHFGIYSFSVPFSDVVNLPATNMVALNFKDPYNLNVRCHIIYALLPFNQFFGLRGPMKIDKETETVAIFRQSIKNRLNIYVRSNNVTDKFSHRIKQIGAYIISLFWWSKKARSLVLLYEKNSSKYEESASVLFEELIDSGYNNAYFIVTKNYEFFDRIPKKYLSNIIYKYSFKHYLYFFKSKTFIGTEAIAHSIDLKTFNVLALKKIASKSNNYVFLQHGVMYMVSLNSESRGMFKRKVLKGKYRVVVSSKEEADHFITLGRHLPEDLYITGLPKFDRNTYSKNADKIVIMPTWRPWEINEARADFTDTPYFKMIMRIFDSVPEHLKEKVIILPHPLIVNELKKLPDTVTEKIVLDARYDDILKETAVLITDYSSIAYDAFYRGARVIFFWEEKDYCMLQYGPSTKLMLNEENVYGDYFYSTDGLAQAIERNFNNSQTAEQLKRYSQLVNFHDGKNTKRLIDFLKEDGII